MTGVLIRKGNVDMNKEREGDAKTLSGRWPSRSQGERPSTKSFSHSPQKKSVLPTA